MVSDQTLFNYSQVFIFIVTIPIINRLCQQASPYGKHRSPGADRTIPAPIAWFFMECPTLWNTLLLFRLGQNHSNPKAQIMMLPYLFHYFHRTLIYPLRIFIKARNNGKAPGGFPLSIAIPGFFFNIFNSYLQARWVSHYAYYDDDGDAWFWWRFGFGLAVFMTGMVVNVESDYALLGLKNEGGNGYKIPRGGWFEWVSCPNYLGEMMEWLGWALMTWSWAGLGFFWFTSAILVPRAIKHHEWYLQKFGDVYPKERKAIIPFLY